MEHKTGLALAGAVVLIGGSGAVAYGAFTAAIGPSPTDVPVVAASEQATIERTAREARRRKPRIERITRVVYVPMPASAAAAAGPVAPTADAVAPAPTASAVPAGEDRREPRELFEQREELIWALDG